MSTQERGTEPSGEIIIPISDPKLDQPSVHSLSDRELEVFELIGHGRTTRQIADQLHLSPKTVETHRDRIKGKLNLSNTTELTLHAVKWVLEKQ